MNEIETRRALDKSRALRGTTEETKRLLDAIEGARQQSTVFTDNMAYILDVLKERVEMQSVQLAMIERLLKLKEKP